MIVRHASEADREFLASMFVEAVLWRPKEPRIDLQELLRNPRLAAYLAEWGRAGDVALIAMDGDAPIGAAWFRLFTSDAPGYGFVAEDVPELGVAVVSGRRGQGIGRILLRELQREAAARGYGGLSLSVHPDNPARRLYDALGFTPVTAEASAVTMSWRVG